MKLRGFHLVYFQVFAYEAVFLINWMGWEAVYKTDVKIRVCLCFNVERENVLIYIIQMKKTKFTL